jgi:hypothetical protein
MNDVTRLVLEAWEKLGPKIMADSDELNRRLARRRKGILTKPVRAWCLGLRGVGSADYAGAFRPIFTEQTNPKNVASKGTRTGGFKCLAFTQPNPAAPIPRADSPIRRFADTSAHSLPRAFDPRSSIFNLRKLQPTPFQPVLRSSTPFPYSFPPAFTPLLPRFSPGFCPLSSRWQTSIAAPSSTYAPPQIFFLPPPPPRAARPHALTPTRPYVCIPPP